MRLPKRGEKGFTLIELLIVVAILGVLAAVVIPNVGRFIGAGTEEARETEFSNVQTAVHAMMVDNEISTLPAPVTIPTNHMDAFPDATSSNVVPSAEEPGKVTDPEGFYYDFTGDPSTDKAGYVLFGHDISGSGTAANPDQIDVNYVAQKLTAYLYTVDASGTVAQGAAAPTE